MTCGYRGGYRVLAHTRGAENPFAGWWQLINSLGTVPRVRDGEGASRWCRHTQNANRPRQGFRGNGSNADQGFDARPARSPSHRGKQLTRLARDHYIRLDSNGDTTNICNPDHVKATAALGRDRIALVYRRDRTTEMDRDYDGAVA
jgi:hypothetical protein